jgi:hypothetical protein
MLVKPRGFYRIVWAKVQTHMLCELSRLQILITHRLGLEPRPVRIAIF